MNRNSFENRSTLELLDLVQGRTQLKEAGSSQTFKVLKSMLHFRVFCNDQYEVFLGLKLKTTAKNDYI